MTGLTLIGVDGEGAQLVVEDATGQRLLLPITDELRRMVRHAPAPAAQEPANDEPPTLSPREIQQRLRAGLTPEELAEISGEPLGTIDKFAAPVLAERRFVIEQARATRIGREGGAPVLEDLVVNRLAARGVEPEEISWEAWRAPDEPWHVAVDFRSEGRGVRAAWTYDHTARSLTAEDEESRWLTETELLDAPIPRRHLSAVRAEAPTTPGGIPTRPVTDRVLSDGAPPSAAIPMPEPALLSPTEALLEELDGMRGTRESVDVGDEDSPDDDAFEGFGPAAQSRMAKVGYNGEGAGAPSEQETESTRPAGSTHPAGSGSRPPADAANPETPGSGERKAKKGRASVPSWDEIVFGARHHQD